MGQDQIKILFVDDDSDGFSAVEAFLNFTGGFSVDFAASGLDALIKFEKNNYDLIISDCIMPEMDGLTLLDEVRRRSDIPMLLMSGFPPLSWNDDFEKAILLDAAGFLQKPIYLAELVYKINQVLNSGKDAAIAFYKACLNSKFVDPSDYSNLFSVYKLKHRIDEEKKFIEETLAGNFTAYDMDILRDELNKLEKLEADE